MLNPELVYFAKSDCLFLSPWIRIKKTPESVSETLPERKSRIPYSFIYYKRPLFSDMIQTNHIGE